MRLSGVTVAWRGTSNLDDWVAYIMHGAPSKKLILADHASERKVKTLMTRLQTLSRKDIEQLADATPRKRRSASTGIRNKARSPKPAVWTKEVIRIHREGGLSARLIARATGATLSTVQDWLTLQREPTDVRTERIAELAAIVERIGRFMAPEYIPVWLSKPIAALDDEKPIDLLRRGQSDRVARLVSSLEESGAA
jgi:DNA-binding transcriptional regulator YiaG